LPADRPRTLAGITASIGAVKAVSTHERRPALPAVGARIVGDHSIEAVTASPAPIFVQKLAAVASEAMLPVLTSAVLADVTGGDGGVALGSAFAPVVYLRLHNEPARLARKRLGTAALEQTNARGCQPGWTRLDTIAVRQIKAVAADPTCVTVSSTIAPVTVLVQAPTTCVSLRARLNPATLA